MLTNLSEWQALAAHYQSVRGLKMRDWFAKDPERFSRFSVRMGGILFDYSKNRVTPETMALLGRLALAVDLPQKIRALFSAEPVNTTENRPALHMALRSQAETFLGQQGQAVLPLVREALEKMRCFVEAVHEGRRQGATGKPFSDIVNIGIGGSHLGPLMATQALVNEAQSPLRFHFISDVDDFALQEVLNNIDPERTLFIVSSKSFTTLETLTNAKSCCAWLEARLSPLLTTSNLRETILNAHFIAVTAKEDKAREFGIANEKIFPIWAWVGGRYSIWSAIGLPLALQIGMAGFQSFLEGAAEADQHFYSAEWTHNIPVIMGLLGIWYLNFFEAPTQAIIPYDYRLKNLRAYLQQLDMESNGKSITHAGLETAYSTGPIVWGELGLHGQHAFHQLLHQGTHLVPVDFLLVGQNQGGQQPSGHELLIANALSQARALMHGKEAEEFKEELAGLEQSAEENLRLAKHKEVPGNRPSTILFMDQLTPKNLGALIALYEHKIFVQSVIWNVNPFDQWGVELGKTILPSVLEAFRQNESSHHHDSSTDNLIRHYKNLKVQA